MYRTAASSAALLSLLLTAAVAAPALAAKPTFEVIDIGTPADEAWTEDFLFDLCGFEITVSSESTVTVHVFSDNSGEFRREIDKYLIVETYTNPETDASVTLHDVGPDLFSFNKDGELLLALVGRSLTGSGYIGRYVVNLDTEETLSIAGLNAGTLEEQICQPLAP